MHIQFGPEETLKLVFLCVCPERRPISQLAKWAAPLRPRPAQTVGTARAPDVDIRITDLQPSFCATVNAGRRNEIKETYYRVFVRDHVSKMHFSSCCRISGKKHVPRSSFVATIFVAKISRLIAN